MESKDGSVQETAGNVLELESFNQRLGQYITDVQQYVQKLKDEAHFDSTANRKHPNAPEGVSMVGVEYKEKLVESSKKRQPIAAHIEIVNAKRQHVLMPEVGPNIVHKVTQHKCAKPLMQPADVVGLGLHDNCEESKQKGEDTEMQQDIYLSEEAGNAKIGRKLAAAEIVEIDKLLDELRDLVTEKCRKMTIEEKKRLGDAIAQLSPEGIDKVNLFLRAEEPNIQGTGETVEIDLDAQTSSSSCGGDDNEGNNLNNDTGKQETCDDVTKD